MILTKMEVVCLDCIADDYENTRTILPDVTRELNGPVTEEEVATCLTGLAMKGLAEAFVFDREQWNFVRHDKLGAPDLWFCVTQRGIEERDANWGIVET